MAKAIIAADAPRLDGIYEFDEGYFTNRELHLIKKEAGVRAGELNEALDAGDNDLLVVIAYIAMQRNGRLDVPISALWDLPMLKIAIEFDEEEEESDALPPVSAPGSSDSGLSSTDSSSVTLNGSSEVIPVLGPQNVTGEPG